jgi:hypothetical protein
MARRLRAALFSLVAGAVLLGFASDHAPPDLTSASEGEVASLRRADAWRAASLGDGNSVTNRTPISRREPLGPSSRRTGLVISEIMYHPAPRADGKHLAFVEVFNSEATFINLGRYRLSGSIEFIFPTNQIIPAGGFLVVAQSPTDIASTYGITNGLGA